MWNRWQSPLVRVDIYDLPLYEADLNVLCLEERVRAENYLNDVPRRRFIVGRSLLRKQLGSFL